MLSPVCSIPKDHGRAQLNPNRKFTACHLLLIDCFLTPSSHSVIISQMAILMGPRLLTLTF